MRIPMLKLIWFMLALFGTSQFHFVGLRAVPVVDSRRGSLHEQVPRRDCNMLIIPDTIELSSSGGSFCLKTQGSCGFFKLRISKSWIPYIHLSKCFGFIDGGTDEQIKVFLKQKIKTFENPIQIQVNYIQCQFSSIETLFNQNVDASNVVSQTSEVSFSLNTFEDTDYEEGLLFRKLNGVAIDINTYLLHYPGIISERNKKIICQVAGYIAESQASSFLMETKCAGASDTSTQENFVVTNFLKKLCFKNSTDITPPLKVRLRSVYVLLMQLAHSKSIPKEAAHHNLQLYAISGSKTLVELQNKKFGGGSYYHLREYYSSRSLKGSVQEALAWPEEEEGVVTIPIGDNIQPQIMPSNSYVVDQKIPMEVSYNLMFGRIKFFQKHLNNVPDLVLGKKYQLLLKDPRNKPGNWAVIGAPSPEEMRLLEEFEKDFTPFAVTVMRSIVATRMQNIILKDSVDAAQKLPSREMYKVCWSCAGSLKIEQEICNHCKVNQRFLKENKSPYDDIPSPLIHRKIESVPGPLANCNPNGFDNCRKAFRHVEQSCITGGNVLGLLYQDAVPFKYMSQNRQYVKICLDHDTCFFDFPWEADEFHTKCSTKYRFDSIHLENSLGHIGFGLDAEITEMMWEPFLKAVAARFGITTPGAVKSLKKAKNHHKQIKAIWSLVYGILDELCYHFVNLRKAEGDLMDPKRLADDFLCNFSSTFVNENYIAAFELCKIGLYRIILRKSVRKGESNVALGALCALRAVPFSQHHPTAIETRIRWMLNLAVCRERRPELFDLLKNLLMVTKSKDYSYQPPDLHQEEIIPWLNNLLFGKRGSFESYSAAAVNLRILSDFIKEDPGDSKRKFDCLEEQTLAVRLLLRESNIFNDPMRSCPLVSVCGRPLSTNFHNLVNDMERKCKEYREKLVKRDYSQIELSSRTPITFEEEEKQSSAINQPHHILYDKVKEEIEKLEDGERETLIDLLNSKPKIQLKKFEANFGVSVTITGNMDHGCVKLCDLIENLDEDVRNSEKFKNFVKTKIKCWTKSDLIEILENVEEMLNSEVFEEVRVDENV